MTAETSTTSRRGLLAIAALPTGLPVAANSAPAVADPGTPVPPPPVPRSSTGGDVAKAQAFLSRLVLGLNVERSWAANLPGDKLRYYRYLAGLGCTHVRLFYHYVPSQPQMGGKPDIGMLNASLDGVSAALRAGLSVMFDVTDVSYRADPTMHADAYFGWIRNAARAIRARNFPVDKFACGPSNEFAGEGNGFWNAHMARGIQAMRAELPNHTLIAGGGFWKHHGSILWPDREPWGGAGQFGKFVPVPDMNVIYDWHHYISEGATYWRGVATELKAWSKANGGRPTICGEAGIGYWAEDVNGTELQHADWIWPERLEQQIANTAVERPMLWAVSYGGASRLNRSESDPRLKPNVEEWFRMRAAANRKTLGL